MANKNQPAISFDEFIKEGRKKRQAEKLAQEIFGKNRRGSAPPSGPKAGMGGSLASRMGVNKPRNSSLPRANTPRQQHRLRTEVAQPQQQPQRRPQPPASFRSQPVVVDVAKSNGHVNGDEEPENLIIRGAASAGPFTVVAQNFAPGTTAADIESVMLSVGGEMTSCRLTQAMPMVIAEMVFIEKSGAEKVIDTFNGKKADGRPLYVYWKADGGAIRTTGRPGLQNRSITEPEPVIVPVAAPEEMVEDVEMEVDTNAQSREAQDRLREERRGTKDPRDPRDDPRDAFPIGPRVSNRDDAYYGNDRSRGGRGDYQDRRYGYEDRRGGGYSGGGRYDREDARWGNQRWRR